MPNSLPEVRRPEAPAIVRDARAMHGPLVRRRPAVPVLAVVRWAFYLFVFSIPLEYPQRSIPLEVHTITGSLFLLAALLQPRLCFRRPPAAFYWLSAFVWIYAALGMFSLHGAETAKLFFDFLLVTFTFWVGSNLLRFDAVARRAFLGFIIAAAIVGLMQRFEIASGEVEGRVVVFGQDPNLLGANMALALLMLLGLAYGRNRVPMRFHVLAGLGGLLLLRTLFYSASRGASLAFVIGLVMFAFRGGNLRTIARHVTIAVVAATVVMLAAYRNQSLLKRYQETVSTGDLSGREEIFPEAMKMFRERPFFGWGPVNHNYELGLRTSGFQIGARNADGVAVHLARDTHDIVLDILTSVGLVGAFPFFMAIALALWSAWRVRAGPRATLPLALGVCAVAVGLSINVAASKQLWLVMAYAVASARQGASSRVIAVRPRQPRVVAAT